MVPENKVFFCNTMATPFRRCSSEYSFTLTPSTSTSPSSQSYNLGISCTRELLPDPVDPMIPITSPGWATKLMS